MVNIASTVAAACRARSSVRPKASKARPRRMGRVGDVKKKSWRKILQDNYMDIIQEIDVIDVILICNNIHIKPKYRRRKI